MMQGRLVGTPRRGRPSLAQGHAALANHQSNERARLAGARVHPVNVRLSQDRTAAVGLPLAVPTMSPSECDRWCPAYLW